MSYNYYRTSNRDMVCGVFTDGLKSAITFFYNNRVLRFCSKTCLNKFKKHPRRYIGKRRQRRLSPRMRLPINGTRGFHP